MELDLGFAPGNTVDDAVRAAAMIPREQIIGIECRRVARRDDASWAAEHGVQPYSPEMMEHAWFPKYWWSVKVTLA